MSNDFNLVIKLVAAVVYVFALNILLIASTPLLRLNADLAAAPPPAPPPVPTVAAIRTASSKSILLIIPMVYALLTNKSLKKALVPPLEDLPILIASSIA